MKSCVMWNLERLISFVCASTCADRVNTTPTTLFCSVEKLKPWKLSTRKNTARHCYWTHIFEMLEGIESEKSMFLTVLFDLCDQVKLSTFCTVYRLNLRGNNGNCQPFTCCMAGTSFSCFLFLFYFNLSLTITVFSSISFFLFFLFLAAREWDPNQIIHFKELALLTSSKLTHHHLPMS